MKKILLVCLGIVFTLLAKAQSTDTIPVFEYTEPKDYEIGGIKVTGAEYSDDNAIINISGLKVGDKVRIPGSEIPQAIKALWKLRLFTDIQILKEKTVGDVIFLEIQVQERPRLTQYTYRGVKKSYQDDLNEQVNKHILKGGIVTEDVKVNASREIEKFFIDKGYLDVAAKVIEEADSSRINAVRLIFDVNVDDRVKIDEIRFVGNKNIKDKRLLKQLDKTKEKHRLFASSKFIKKEFEKDKKRALVELQKIPYLYHGT